MLKTDINCQVTMVSVISRVLDSINVLEKLRELCKDQVDYIVVKNLFHGEEEKFERYNDAFLRQNMLAKGLVELVMPDLFYKSYDFIDRHALTFNEGQTHQGTNIVIKSWLAEFEAQIKPAFNLLAFDTQPIVLLSCTRYHTVKTVLKIIFRIYISILVVRLIMLLSKIITLASNLDTMRGVNSKLILKN